MPPRLMLPLRSLFCPCCHTVPAPWLSRTCQACSGALPAAAQAGAQSIFTVLSGRDGYNPARLPLWPPFAPLSLETMPEARRGHATPRHSPSQAPHWWQKSIPVPQPLAVTVSVPSRTQQLTWASGCLSWSSRNRWLCSGLEYSRTRAKCSMCLRDRRSCNVTITSCKCHGQAWVRGTGSLPGWELAPPETPLLWHQHRMRPHSTERGHGSVSSHCWVK